MAIIVQDYGTISGGEINPTSIDSMEIQSGYQLTKDYLAITLVYCNTAYETTDWSGNWLLNNQQSTVRKGGTGMSVSGAGCYSVATFYNCKQGDTLTWATGVSQRTLFIGVY